MHLSGWARLWIVFTVLWMAATGAAWMYSHQSDQERYHEWSNALIEYLVGQSTDLKGHTVASVRSAYSDMSDKQLIQALHEKYLPKHPAYRFGFAEIDAQYRKGAPQFRVLPRLDAWAWWGAIAVGIPFLVLAIGKAGGWVRDGFRRA